MVVRGRETGWGLTDQSASVLGLLYTDNTSYIWSRAIHGLSMESVWHVGQVSPYRVYIDSNHQDSQI
jgi:hypothetical protein